jgi:hypothetical protein
MGYIVSVLLGMVIGALGVGLALMNWYARARQKAKAVESQARRAKEAAAAADAKEKELAELSRQMFQDRRELDSHLVSYRELEQENKILKTDLKNIAVQIHKLELDADLQRRQLKDLNDRSTQLARRYVAEAVKSIVASAGPNNFTACRDQLSEVIAQCRANQFPVSPDEEAGLLADLQKHFDRGAPAQFATDAQSRI